LAVGPTPAGTSNEGSASGLAVGPAPGDGAAEGSAEGAVGPSLSPAEAVGEGTTTVASFGVELLGVQPIDASVELTRAALRASIRARLLSGMAPLSPMRSVAGPFQRRRAPSCQSALLALDLVVTQE
jgi:hypothetical protein